MPSFQWRVGRDLATRKRGFGHQRGSSEVPGSNADELWKISQGREGPDSRADLETVRKTVEARKGKTGDGNGAGPILIDVREKDEWTEGFIPGAQLDPARLPRAAHRGPGPRAVVGDRPLLRGRHALGAGGAVARRARLHQRQVDGGRLHGLEARRAAVRPPVHHDARSRRCATRATPCCPRSARRGRSSCSSRRCCASARAASARRSGLYLAAAGVGTHRLRRRRRGRRVEPAAADPPRDRSRRHAQGRVGERSPSPSSTPT